MFLYGDMNYMIKIIPAYFLVGMILHGNPAGVRIHHLTGNLLTAHRFECDTPAKLIEGSNSMI